MTLQELLVIMQNRLLTLNEARKSAINLGDLEQVNRIDGDLITTCATVEKIQKTIELDVA